MTDPEIERIMREKMRGMMRPPRRILDLDDRTFQGALSRHRLVLVDFWAEWCGPCRSMHPVFEGVSKSHENVQFARVNVDGSGLVSAKYGVRSIPTFMLFRDGLPVERLTGAVGAQTLHATCRKHSQ